MAADLLKQQGGPRRPPYPASHFAIRAFTSS
jgi:hypothetical protein